MWWNRNFYPPLRWTICSPFWKLPTRDVTSYWQADCTTDFLGDTSPPLLKSNKFNMAAVSVTRSIIHPRTLGTGNPGWSRALLALVWSGFTAMTEMYELSQRHITLCFWLGIQTVSKPFLRVRQDEDITLVLHYLIFVYTYFFSIHLYTYTRFFFRVLFLNAA